MWKRNGQSTLEYALLIVLVAGVLFTVVIFAKRGFLGGYRASIDQRGEQFSPYASQWNITSSTQSNRTETLANNGAAQTQITSEFSNRSGSEDIVANLNDENLF